MPSSQQAVAEVLAVAVGHELDALGLDAVAAQEALVEQRYTMRSCGAVVNQKQVVSSR